MAAGEGFSSCDARSRAMRDIRLLARHRARSRVRGEPDQRAAAGAQADGPHPQHGHPEHGRHPQDRGSRACFVREVLKELNQVSRQTVPAHTSTSPCNAVARMGTPGCRQTRPSGSRATCRPERRHGDPGRDDRDVWRRAPLHASRREPRGRREAGRPDAVVGGVHPQARRGDQCQPVAGNKAGGLTTIIEKSLGAMAKAGSTNLVDVVKYAEPVTQKGFVCMDTPGFDPVPATGQVAGGANLVCFTTGRAACSAASPRRRSRSRPTRLCSSAWRRTWTSIVGTIVDGQETVQEAGQRIFERILQVPRANGPRASSTMPAPPSSRPGRLARRLTGCFDGRTTWLLMSDRQVPR